MNISASKKVKCKGKFAVTVELDEGSFEKRRFVWESFVSRQRIQ